MTTTYKLLKQYYLDRDDTYTTTSGSGYYYGADSATGTSTENSDFNNRFNTVEVDARFNTLDFNSGVVYAAVEQEDGKIIIGGTFTSINGTSRGRIARLNSDGTLDSDFNITINNPVYNISLQPDGKILVAGEFTTVGGVSKNNIARLNSDGTLDTSFTTTVNNAIADMKVQPDQKILIVGQFTSVNSTTRNRMARLESNGILDSSFNPNLDGETDSIDIQSDGKIIISGTFNTVGGVSKNAIARLNSNGTLDTSFTTNISISYLGGGVTVQPDDKIIIAGSENQLVTVNGTTVQSIARLNSDGTLDDSFHLAQIGTDPLSIRHVMIQPDNKIVLTGRIRNVDNVVVGNIVRLNSDGTRDESFAATIENPLQFISQNNGSIFLSGNRILVYGDFTQANDVTTSGVTVLKERVVNAPYQLIYTVPSSTSVILGSIFSTNHNDFPIYYDIAVVPYEDGTVSEKHHLVWDSLLDNNDFNILKDKVTLSAGDKIYVYSSTDEKISFNIFGTEITA